MKEEKTELTDLEKIEQTQQKYYSDKAQMEKSITESLCKFVYLYGGRLNVEIEVSAEDTVLADSGKLDRRVWTDSVKITTLKS